MKRIMPILLPSIIISFFMYFIRDKGILIGLYILFPFIFILQGIICSKLKKDLFVGVTLSSATFVILINTLFNMGSGIGLTFIYVMMSIISYLVKNKCRIKY